MSISREVLKEIPTGQIKPNPENPRLVFRSGEMESLTISINRHGIQVPITVYREGAGYRLLDGERRWRCAKKLNLAAVPAIVKHKPNELKNLLLMYNIHALREQWDLFTQARGLERIIRLYRTEHGKRPTENQLVEETGLNRFTIRRCNYLIELPEKYKKDLLRELELPKSQRVLTEDVLIEMERALKTVNRRVYDELLELNPIRDALISKVRSGTIKAVTDFRQLAKVARAVDTLELQPRRAKAAFAKVFEADNGIGIREVYEGVAEQLYDAKRIARNASSVTEYLDDLLESGGDLPPELDQPFTLLHRRLREYFGGKT